MDNFKDFVDSLVKKWRVERIGIFEKKGLGRPSNREIGDLAEAHMVKRIKRLAPEYEVVLAKGSQTPADIYGFAKTKHFNHVMLLQIKSSNALEHIYMLNKLELKQFYELGKFVKKELSKNADFRSSKNKPLMVTMGYMGVFNEPKKGKVKPILFRCYMYKSYVTNFVGIDPKKTDQWVREKHFSFLY